MSLEGGFDLASVRVLTASPDMLLDARSGRRAPAWSFFACSSGPIKISGTGHIRKAAARLKVSSVSNLHQLFYITLFS